MDEQPVPMTQPPLVPTPVPTPAPAPPPVGPAPPKFMMPPIRIYVIFAVILLTAGIIGVVIITLRSAPAKLAPTPTPVAATPTPAQPLSPIATQSAFLQFASSVASLSTAVSESSLQDQMLTPPVLTLPLGF
jgi:hypothetical protein